MDRDGTETVPSVPATKSDDSVKTVPLGAGAGSGGGRSRPSRTPVPTPGPRHRHRLFLLIGVLGLALGLLPSQASAASGPTNTSPPDITGETTVGQTLTVDPGEWSGDPEPTFTYQWQRCEQSAPSATYADVTWPVPGFSGGISVDPGGNVFLASLDGFEGAVDKFGPTGSLLASYTDPDISGVWDVATDSAGNVYATNQFSETVTKTTPGGDTSVFVDFKEAPYNGTVLGTGIDVDADGNVYVTSTTDNAGKVLKFDSTGTEVSTGGFPITFGVEEVPQDVAVDNAGRIYVIVSNYLDEGLVARFLPNGTADGEWGRPTALGGSPFEGVLSITLDGAGNLFVAESDRVIVFDSSMSYITNWTGGVGGGGGTAFSGLRGIAAGADGAVYTSQLLGGSGGNGVMQKFTFSTGLDCQPISGAEASTYQVGPDDGGNRLRATVTASNSEGSAQATSALTSEVRVSTLVVDDTGTATGSIGQTGTCEAPNFNTIQAAVDAATAGDTVQVCEGEYSVSSPVTVGKSLTINGSGKARTTVSTDWSTPATDPAFLVNANDVTVTDMKVTNTSATLRRGIQWATAGSGLTVTNVDFADIAGANSYGIVATANLSDLEVSGSSFTAGPTSIGVYNSAAGIYAGQNFDLSDWTVTDSTFENLFMGIWTSSSMNGLTVTGSTFGPFDPSDATSGTASIYIGDLAAGGEVKNIEVTENDFTDTTRGLYIWNYASGGSIGSVQVKDNTFTDSIFSSAVRVIAGGLSGVKMPLEGPVEVEGNTFIQNEKIPGGQGVGMIDLRASAESATDSVKIRNNTITFTGPFDVTTVGVVVHGSLTNLTISGNTMNGNNAGGTFTNMPPTSGIWLLTNISQSGPMSDKARYSIANNVITGFGDGIAAFDWTTRTYGNIPVGAQVGVIRNSLSGNSGPSIQSGSTGATIDATCNWWGQASGPESGQSTGNVNNGSGTLRFLQSAGLDSPCIGNPQPSIDPTTSFKTVGSLVSLERAGNWDIPEGTGPLTLGYQWETCDFFLCEPDDWFPISGATASTYRLTESDLGKRLRAVITATNPGPGGGSATYPALDVFRNPFGPIIAPSSSAEQPTPETPPEGENVQVNFPAIDNGQQISLDFGCEITEEGTTTVQSRDASQVPEAQGFRFGDPPTTATIETTAEYNCQGSEVISVCTYFDAGSLPDGTNPKLFHFVDGGWVDVTVSWDPETGILCGDVTSFSPFAVGRAAASPANNALPGISGTAKVGETLNATSGTWSGDEPITYAYQWVRCESDGAGCSNIAGASSTSYVPVAADAGKKLKVKVTATNDGGSGSATSALTDTVEAEPVPPSGDPNLKVNISSPKKVRAGKAFGASVKVANLSEAPAARSTRSAPATKLQTCVRLPKGTAVQKAKGAKVSGRSVCWTRSSLAVDEAATYRLRIKVFRSASGKRTLRAAVSAENDAGREATADGKRQIRILKALRPKPNTPTG